MPIFGQIANGAALLKAAQENGPFAVGALVGWFITDRANASVRQEWQEEKKAQREREVILQQQLEKKEQRIDALHDKLEKLHGVPAAQSNPKKKQ